MGMEAIRKNLARHGITWEQKCWLVFQYQEGNCPLCLRPLTIEEAVIDHCHVCIQSGTHQAGRGCKLCIRGALHGICNSPVLMWLERFPHLQNDFVKAYLERRPFSL